MEENISVEEEFNILQNENFTKEGVGQVPYSNEEIQKKVNLQLGNIIKKDVSVDTEDTIENNIKTQFVYKGVNGYPLYRIVNQKEGEEYVVQSYQNGKYEFGMNGAQKVPYNLPQLNNCESKIVWVVNGEDKADLLTNLGFIATTAPFKGNKKWKEEYNSYLQSCKGVIVLQDNKSNNSKYVVNTYNTLKNDIDNVGIVNILDLAISLNIGIPEETTLIDFANQLNDRELLKKALKELETQM